MIAHISTVTLFQLTYNKSVPVL